MAGSARRIFLSNATIQGRSKHVNSNQIKSIHSPANLAVLATVVPLLLPRGALNAHTPPLRLVLPGGAINANLRPAPRKLSLILIRSRIVVRAGNAARIDRRVRIAVVISQPSLRVNRAVGAHRRPHARACVEGVAARNARVGEFSKCAGGAERSAKLVGVRINRAGGAGVVGHSAELTDGAGRARRGAGKGGVAGTVQIGRHAGGAKCRSCGGELSGFALYAKTVVGRGVRLLARLAGNAPGGAVLSRAKRGRRITKR